MNDSVGADVEHMSASFDSELVLRMGENADDGGYFVGRCGLDETIWGQSVGDVEVALEDGVILNGLCVRIRVGSIPEKHFRARCTGGCQEEK